MLQTYQTSILLKLHLFIPSTPALFLCGAKKTTCPSRLSPEWVWVSNSSNLAVVLFCFVLPAKPSC